MSPSPLLRRRNFYCLSSLTSIARRIFAQTQYISHSHCDHQHLFARFNACVGQADCIVKNSSDGSGNKNLQRIITRAFVLLLSRMWATRRIFYNSGNRSSYFLAFAVRVKFLILVDVKYSSVTSPVRKFTFSIRRIAASQRKTGNMKISGRSKRECCIIQPHFAQGSVNVTGVLRARVVFEVYRLEMRFGVF